MKLCKLGEGDSMLDVDSYSLEDPRRSESLQQDTELVAPNS